MEDLDPIKLPGFVFDPSNPNVAGRIVGITMMPKPAGRSPMSSASMAPVCARFIRAILRLTRRSLINREHPIYVGKADPTNPASKTAMEQGE
jgi:hypothetical protein